MVSSQRPEEVGGSNPLAPAPAELYSKSSIMKQEACLVVCADSLR